MPWQYDDAEALLFFDERADRETVFARLSLDEIIHLAERLHADVLERKGDRAYPSDLQLARYCLDLAPEATCSDVAATLAYISVTLAPAGFDPATFIEDFYRD